MGTPSTALVFFITGASRGLGLGMVTGLMAQGAATVIAAARRPDTSEALQELVDQFPERVVTVAMDTSSEASIKAAAEEVDENFPGGIDYLINMAGVMEDKVVSALDTEGSDYRRVLKVNTVGPFLTTQAFYPLLMKRATRTIVNVSSAVGSVGMQRAGGLPGLAGKCIAYCSSKAALNMQTAVLANALKDKSFTVVSACPGWVDTDMGSRSDTKEVTDSGPILTVEQSTHKHLELIMRLTTADSGKFISAPLDQDILY